MSDPATLCPYGCDVQVEEGGPRDHGRYHCPKCMRCVPALTLARAAYARGGEVAWQAPDPPPDSARNVLALYRRHQPAGVVQVIVAEFGSEGKWLARDHDYRLTYLDEDTVFGWRELPGVARQFTHTTKP